VGHIDVAHDYLVDLVCKTEFLDGPAPHGAGSDDGDAHVLSSLRCSVCAHDMRRCGLSDPLATQPAAPATDPGEVAEQIS
jgi:hypothetical protein